MAPPSASTTRPDTKAEAAGSGASSAGDDTGPASGGAAIGAEPASAGRSTAIVPRGAGSGPLPPAGGRALGAPACIGPRLAVVAQSAASPKAITTSQSDRRQRLSSAPVAETPGLWLAMKPTCFPNSRSRPLYTARYIATAPVPRVTGGARSNQPVVGIRNRKMTVSLPTLTIALAHFDHADCGPIDGRRASSGRLGQRFA